MNKQQTRLGWRDKNSLFMEIVRFAVIGVYGTLLDYVSEMVLTSLLYSWVQNNADNAIAAFFIQFLLSILGMLIAMPATWALTGVWGFQNVKEEDAKTAKTWKGNLKFLFWSVLGLLGGAILQFIGYMTCLRWSGWNINILVMLGVLMLIGVVVNAAILMVDRSNSLRAQGVAPREALVRGSGESFRAVLMVILASALGMLPIALASNIGSEMRAGIGAASTSGVAVAGILTIFVLPLINALFMKKGK